MLTYPRVKVAESRVCPQMHRASIQASWVQVPDAGVSFGLVASESTSTVERR